VAGEDLQGRHKRRKNKEERMKSVLEGKHLHACLTLICLPVTAGVRAETVHTQSLQLFCMPAQLLTWFVSSQSTLTC